MNKKDAFNPKNVANRQKSVGLQKLRWYCQMCQKQCRDENGFKCHTNSESHLRQMRLYCENSGQILDQFSREFEQGYLEVLSHRHNTKRVSANKVYTEYIADKQHIHMNSTIWTTLTAFCMHLGKEGKAVVDETEKGWFVQWIDRDPKVLARQAAADQRQRHELDEDERKKRMIDAEIRAAEEKMREAGYDPNEEVDNSLVTNGDQKIALTLTVINTTAGVGVKRARVSTAFAADTDSDEGDEPLSKSNQPFNEKSNTVMQSKLFVPPSLSGASFGSSAVIKNKTDLCSTENSNAPSFGVVLERGKSGVYSSLSGGSSSSTTSSSSSNSSSNSSTNCNDKESSKDKDKNKERDTHRKDYWLQKNIIVKIITKKIGGGRFYKAKGRVLRVHDKYVGEVEVDGEVIKVDQADLQTVIPKIGHEVLVLNGRHRGRKGRLFTEG